MAYIGMKAIRRFTANYLCEHCGKEVSINSRVTCEVGVNAVADSLHKVRGLNSNGRDVYGEAAKKTLLEQNCPEAEAKWNKGAYPDEMRKFNGKCPHCKKYQHWSAYFDKDPNEELSQLLCVGFVIIAFAAFVIAAYFTPMSLPLWQNIAILVVLLFAAGFIGSFIGKIIRKLSFPKWVSRTEEIKTVKHTEPVFVAWEEEITCNSFKR
ncbi:MAG: hypothetical protein LBT12_06595 [Oscillospiraceae bacterium]|jgi:hypothetical protein|nr:hypothetical protein [Oscillospiraceae bacterium]